ncbi:MAG: DUF3307 domain-containing protein [Paracoccaceae bacterium]
MIQTFAALILAHALADFLFHIRWVSDTHPRPVPLLLHGLVVLATANLCLGSASPWLAALALAHLATDLGRALWQRQTRQRGLTPFLVEQMTHLLPIAALSVWRPGLWVAGLWAGIASLPALMALAAGLILTLRGGAVAVGLLMEPWAEATPRGLLNGGRVIGTLERGLIFLLILGGQPSGIGFLIAAKSVLRFGTVGDDRAISEYVIIGTLASFAWAILISFLTVFLLHALPPLGIPRLTP